MTDQNPLQKYEKLGIDYNPGNVEPPVAEIVEQLCRQFRAAGLKNY